MARRPLPPELLERGAEHPFDPPAARQRLRAESPVARVDLLNGAQAWMITGYAQARAVLADTRYSSDTVRRTSAMQLTSQQATAAKPGERADGMFIFMDPPEHTRLRRLLTSQFTVRRMQALEERVREIAVEHIEAMRGAGSPADLVPAFALPLPSLVICELLGVAYADRAEFQERSAIALNLTKSDAERFAASAGLRDFMRELVAVKRATPDDMLLSGLIHDDITPPLTDAELVDIGITLLGAGHETTANMLALSTFALLENPEQLAAVRAEPELLSTGVEELLRYLSIVHTGPTRIASEDMELDGVSIAEGDTVVLSVPNANRDAEHWADPERLDLARPRSPHLAFGHGVHQCLGQQLARVELRIGLAELFTRLPGLRLAAPAEEIPLRTDMVIFGVHSLPVAWD
ncbi:MAG TPA: cytochrome P450 [Pseudonocardiaceae bacterium]|nr:cytochrome P450 [Pseudonocardiaceae bacterium]